MDWSSPILSGFVGNLVAGLGAGVGSVAGRSCGAAMISSGQPLIAGVTSTMPTVLPKKFGP